MTNPIFTRLWGRPSVLKISIYQIVLNWAWTIWILFLVQFQCREYNFIEHGCIKWSNFTKNPRSEAICHSLNSLGDCYKFLNLLSILENLVIQEIYLHVSTNKVFGTHFKVQNLGKRCQCLGDTNTVGRTIFISKIRNEVLGDFVFFKLGTPQILHILYRIQSAACSSNQQETDITATVLNTTHYTTSVLPLCS